MALYRDTGVVLRVQKLGEADRIVTLLTRRHGKVRAVAKGVRRTRSRWGARLEPFNHVDVQCYTGRSLDIVTQAQTVDAFGAGIIGDYPRYTAGCAVLETADRLVAEEGEPALRVYLLLVGAIRALSGRERDPSLVLDAFLLRAMSHAGLGPGDQRLRPLRRARPAPGVQRRGRGSGLPALPPARLGDPVAGDVHAARRPAARGLGDRGRDGRGDPAGHQRAGRRAPAVAPGTAAALAAAGGAASHGPVEPSRRDRR